MHPRTPGLRQGASLPGTVYASRCPGSRTQRLVRGGAADHAQHSHLLAQLTLKSPPHRWHAHGRAALDLPVWSPFSQPWQSECRRGGLAGRPSRAEGSSILTLPQAHYRAVHRWVKNGCCQDSNKYAAVSVDVIALMKRNQSRREQWLLAVALGGWRALSPARSFMFQKDGDSDGGEKKGIGT